MIYTNFKGLQLSQATASANFSLYNISASVHTRAVFLFGNSSNDGKRSELNCSDASRGNNVGKWSIDITESAGFPTLKRMSDSSLARHCA
jgi:hypothetical protein